MDDAALLARLESDVAVLEDIARAGDALDAEIPACPGWTASDLFGHLWSVQSWVVEILRTGEVSTAPEPSEQAGTRVEDFLAGLPHYLEQMRAIESERPCWGMGPSPGSPGTGPGVRLTSTRSTGSTCSRSASEPRCA